MQDLNQGPGGIAYPSSSGAPGAQYPPSDPLAGQTGPEMTQPQFVQQQPGMPGFIQQPGMQQPGMMPQPGQVPGGMQMPQGQMPGMPMQNMQPGQMPGMPMQNMQPGQMPGMPMQNMQPGQMPGMQMQPGQVTGMNMQQAYQQPSGPMQYFSPNPQIQRDAPASQSDHDFLEHVYVYDVVSKSRFMLIVAAFLFAFMVFVILISKTDSSDPEQLPAVLMTGFVNGFFQCLALWELLMNPEKIKVRFCKSHDDVTITKQFKGNRIVKEVRKLSELKDVFAIEKWVRSKQHGNRLVGYNVHLSWKLGVDSVFFLTLPKAKEIYQFVFEGRAEIEENPNEFECTQCLKDFCTFFLALIVLGAINAGIMAIIAGF